MNHDKFKSENGAGNMNAGIDPLRYGSAAAYLAATLKPRAAPAPHDPRVMNGRILRVR